LVVFFRLTWFVSFFILRLSAGVWLGLLGYSLVDLVVAAGWSVCLSLAGGGSWWLIWMWLLVGLSVCLSLAGGGSWWLIWMLLLVGLSVYSWWCLLVVDLDVAGGWSDSDPLIASYCIRFVDGA